jgi:hypothetical protein
MDILYNRYQVWQTVSLVYLFKYIKEIMTGLVVLVLENTIHKKAHNPDLRSL